MAGNSIGLVPVRGRWAGGSVAAASVRGLLLGLEFESGASLDRTAFQKVSAEVGYPDLYQAL